MKILSICIRNSIDFEYRLTQLQENEYTNTSSFACSIHLWFLNISGKPMYKGAQSTCLCLCLGLVNVKRRPWSQSMHGLKNSCIFSCCGANLACKLSKHKIMKIIMQREHFLNIMSQIVEYIALRRTLLF